MSTRRWALNYYITRWRQLVWRPDMLVTRCGRESQHPAEGALRPPIESWGSDELERRCWIEEHVPERLGPQASDWAATENGKETRLWPIEWGSICCSSVRSPTPSHTQPFQIKWEVFFLRTVSLVFIVTLLWLWMKIIFWYLLNVLNWLFDDLWQRLHPLYRKRPSCLFAKKKKI